VFLSLSLHNNSASNAKLWLLEITERLPDLMGGSEDNQSKASIVLSSGTLDNGSHGGRVLSFDNMSSASYSSALNSRPSYPAYSSDAGSEQRSRSSNADDGTLLRAQTNAARMQALLNKPPGRDRDIKSSVSLDQLTEAKHIETDELDSILAELTSKRRNRRDVAHKRNRSAGNDVEITSSLEVTARNNTARSTSSKDEQAPKLPLPLVPGQSLGIPPPPPMPDLSDTGEASNPKIKAKNKIHWNKITNVKGSVWNELEEERQTSGLTLDIKKFEGTL
jgi:hypothetical protein